MPTFREPFLRVTLIGSPPLCVCSSTSLIRHFLPRPELGTAAFCFLYLVLALMSLDRTKVSISPFRESKHRSLKSGKTSRLWEMSDPLHLEVRRGFENLSLRSESRLSALTRHDNRTTNTFVSSPSLRLEPTYFAVEICKIAPTRFTYYASWMPMKRLSGVYTSWNKMRTSGVFQDQRV